MSAVVGADASRDLSRWVFLVECSSPALPCLRLQSTSRQIRCRDCTDRTERSAGVNFLRSLGRGRDTAQRTPAGESAGGQRSAPAAVTAAAVAAAAATIITPLVARQMISRSLLSSSSLPSASMSHVSGVRKRFDKRGTGRGSTDESLVS